MYHKGDPHTFSFINDNAYAFAFYQQIILDHDEGFVFQADEQGTPGARNDVFAYGVYKFESSESGNNYCFYLDYRDDRVWGGSPIWSDICLRYDPVLSEFRYGLSFTLSDMTPINNGEVVTFAMVRGASTPTTTGFPNFWQNSLVGLKSAENHPLLSWSTYSNSIDPFTPTGYRVYRKFDLYNPNFVQVGGDLPASKLTFIDDEITLGDPNSHGYLPVQYYIKAINIPETLSIPGKISTPSNTVSIITNQMPQKSKSSSLTHTQFNEISLIHCYPNPFNPSTIISFSLPQTAFTQLKVYDIFGREMKTIVNEILSTGNHQYEFNGKDLSSGVYYYTLKVGNYTASNKMILLK